ncbi:DEAD/DEAH box helicase [Methylobacterium gregans]|uniref:DEAD-box ATP-dependent RNA helicase RhpA n=1 Tax=Methylobacterium gregans TaxID=374424 RepID=A0AA37HMU2_9HYPH|nr:DEAD/DEAH box helicase [Methylobacterium gregans]MDQ0519335.1 superfamily II DNA/RNA helicase [Methylobacterium gregans]GJD78732.1 ATP-dependent RNA helicase RhlE [Methylobacterium gregans]GLS53026.1 DEAD/DEAH box helicase [Methylobacterium gregans]
MPFSDLGLSDKVLQAVSAAGYTEPTPIQAQAIPHVLARRDVLGIAQTGTGKTAAFTLPMLTLLETGRARARMPRTLILEPTRELAAQVEENFERYGTNHKLNVALIIGGVSFADQDAKLTRGTDVLIATPGRLLDHFERGKLLLTGVELLVIDEADRMLDMGFIPDIERIVKMVPFTRQTLFFSATMPPEIERLADVFLHNPQRIEVARPASTAETIVQRLVATGSEGHAKRDRLRRLIRGAEELKNGIIFCNRKRDVALLQKSLVKHGFGAAALHGDMDQRARMAALDGFRNGETPLLVASDVAARGLDIPAVSHVFNFDVPHHPEDYVHRIGRTGRAGRAGAAFTLVGRGDDRSLQAIEALIGQPIPWLDGDLNSVTEDEAGAEETRTRHRGSRSGTERRSRSKSAETRGEGRADGRGGRRATPQRERGETPPRAPEPAARAAAPERVRDERRPPRRPEADGDTPIGLGSHVPAFLLRPVPVKRES